MHWLVKLQQIGTQEDDTSYLQNKTLLTNRACLLLIGICIPYSILMYLFLPQLVMAAVGCIILFSLILLLQSFRLHTLARFAFASSLSLLCFFTHIAYVKPGEPLLTGLLAIQLSMLIVPWLTFDTREPYALGSATLLSLLCLLADHWASGWIEISIDIEVLKGGFFETVFICNAGIILIGGLYLLQTTNLKAEIQNQTLINDMKNAQQLLREKENNLNNYILEIEKARQEDTKRQWAAEGLAKFTEILRSQTDVEQLAKTLISQLVKYLDANQGSLFIINDEEESNVYLALAASYAWNKQKFTKKHIFKGDGLVGQSWIEKDLILLTEIPNDYVHITSGLGKANPTCILILPLVVNNEVFGVIEVASFKILESYQLEFLKKLAETIAGSISSAKINTKTKLLLQQTQQQHEEMRSQEEEMRQNMEELSATQEEMLRSKQEMEQLLVEAQQKEVALKQQEEFMRENLSEFMRMQEQKEEELEALRKKISLYEK